MTLQGICYDCKQSCEDIERPCPKCKGRVFSCPYCKNVNCQVKVLRDGALAWQCTLH